MKGIFARSKRILEDILDLLIIVAPLLLFLFLQAILWDKFSVHVFGETIPLSLLGILAQTLYLAMLTRVYNLGKTSNERLKGVFNGPQKSCD
jgi:hypothetical protein